MSHSSNLLSQQNRSMIGVEVCSTMDQFNHYENLYYNITVTVENFLYIFYL